MAFLSDAKNGCLDWVAIPFYKKKPLILGVMLPFVMIVSNFDSKRRQVKTSDSDWS